MRRGRGSRRTQSSWAGRGLGFLKSEAALLCAVATVLMLHAIGHEWLSDVTHPVSLAAMFVWVFGIILWATFRAVHHADSLAELLGEPYGTLILTISAVAIEISVMLAIMSSAEQYPTLPRDTMLAVVMITLNGLVGVCLLVGGLRFGEQEFNIRGTHAFLAVLIALSILALVLPRFMGRVEPFEIRYERAIPLDLISIALYATFVVTQTIRHRGYFIEPGEMEGVPAFGKHPHGLKTKSIAYHAVLLALTLVPIVLLAEHLAVIVNAGIDTIGVPHTVGGIIIAFLVLAPEGVAALRAALQNHLQRALNICLGSALATISLTIPAVVTFSLVTGTPIQLGLENVGLVLLGTTLLISVVTLAGPRTSLLQGAVHLVIFGVYLTMVFTP